MKRRKCT